MSLTFVKDHSHNFYNSDINSDNILINELSKMLGKIYEDFYYQLWWAARFGIICKI